MKGQNFRVLLGDGGQNYKVVAKATSCTITLQANTENTSHKDIVDNASMPIVTNRSWSVQVESLDVTDMAVLLSAIKSNKKFQLYWSETSTSDNQTPVDDLKRGQAYLSDVNFNFNDREASTKSVTFTGTGPVYGGETTLSLAQITADTSYTMGEKVRLFLGNGDEPNGGANNVIAAAKQLQFHVSVSMESVTTKDTSDAGWQEMEPTEVSYDITTNALVGSYPGTGGDTECTVDGLEYVFIEENTVIPFTICNVTGAHNRTKGTQIVSGKVIITQLTINAANRQNVEYTANMTGFGPYTVVGNAPRI